jgi:hypothetical protein
VSGLLRKIRGTGRVAGPASVPPTDGAGNHRRDGDFGGSIQARHLDAGSSNGCEIEIRSACGSVSDLERYGVRLVASPRIAGGCWRPVR